MTNATQVSWGGYEFSVLENPESANWNEVSGVYIFAKMDASKKWWQALYIGETASFRQRLTVQHERWEQAKEEGATHIHAKVVSDQIERISIERQLIQSYEPMMNKT